MSPSSADPVRDALLALLHGLPRQGPGSDATTRRLLRLAGPLPPRPRVLDAGCGTGRASLLLAAEARAQVTAVDIHQPFLDVLARAAARRGLGERIHTVNCSMARLPYRDGGFDVIWAEGSVYALGFDAALRAWRRLLGRGGVLVVTECEWSTATPSPPARDFWDAAYPLRIAGQNVAAARRAGYEVSATWTLPERDWWAEYYTPLSRRLTAADPALPGMAEAIDQIRAEINIRRDHARDYRFTGYVLRPQTPSSPPSH